MRKRSGSRRERASCGRVQQQGVLVPHARHRCRHAPVVDRERRARDPAGDALVEPTLATVRDGRPAQERLAPRRRVPGRAHHDRGRRLVRADPLARRDHPVRVRIPTAVGRSRRGRLRSTDRAHRHESPAGAARIRQLARGALARVRVLAGRARARARHGQRHPPPVGARARVAQRRSWPARRGGGSDSRYSCPQGVGSLPRRSSARRSP